MNLLPLTEPPRARYPQRRAGLALSAGNWARRIGAAAFAATLIALVGCPSAGAMRPPGYYCSAEQSHMADLTISGQFSGELCGGMPVSGLLELSEPITLTVSLSTPGSYATVDIVNTGGAVVATASPNEPAEVNAEPGEWELVVTPDGSADLSFTLTISTTPSGG